MPSANLRCDGETRRRRRAPCPGAERLPIRAVTPTLIGENRNAPAMMIGEKPPRESVRVT